MLTSSRFLAYTDDDQSDLQTSLSSGQRDKTRAYNAMLLQERLAPVANVSWVGSILQSSTDSSTCNRRTSFRYRADIAIFRSRPDPANEEMEESC